MNTILNLVYKTFNNVYTVLVIALLLIVSILSACETPVADENTSAPEAPAVQESQVAITDVREEADEMPKLLEAEAFFEKIKYPAVAKKAGIEGRVFVEFVVDKEGNVVNPVIKKGIGSGCDEEALRAIKLATFSPGMVDGEAVNVKLVMPFTFKLNTEG